jgi:hypothetical protein
MGYTCSVQVLLSTDLGEDVASIVLQVLDESTQPRAYNFL